jgi:hypothetical protein
VSSEETPYPLRCPACHGDLAPAKWGRPGRECQSCRRYYPSPEERAKTRAMFGQWRQLLLAVAELHKQSYECARIIPFVVDTAGGGDWHCIVAPAALISPAHGAQIDKHIDWWSKPCSPGMDFPYIMGRAYWEPPFEPISAEDLIRRYPKLAELCLGRDGDYVEWYQLMLQATAPDGVIYDRAECWGEEDLPGNRMRVLTPEGARDVLVPLPPPGRYQREVAARWEPVPQPARITRENVARIRRGMTSAEVRSILGDGGVIRRGECVERSGGNWPPRTTAVLDWQEGCRRVTITFENDEVLEVDQRGLE